MPNSPKQLDGWELANELSDIRKPVVILPPGFEAVAVTGVNVEKDRIVLTTFPMNKEVKKDESSPG